MTRFAVCDDDAQVLDRVQELIRSQFGYLEPEIGCFKSSEELRTEVTQEGFTPDIAVLDIMIGDDGCGIELAKWLNGACPDCQIVFLTSHLSMATEVYETRHSYFVLKEQIAGRLGSAIEKALKERHLQEQFQIKTHSGMLLIPVREVLYLERTMKMTSVVTRTTRHMTNKKPEELLSQIHATPFFRCHQSFWVNMEHVTGISPDGFYADNGELVPISRSYRLKAKTAFHDHLCRSLLSHDI